MRGLTVVAALLVLSGCKGDEVVSQTAPTPQAASAPVAERVVLDIAIDGASWATATPGGEGYKLAGAGGTDLGKIKVGADRVKLKNAAGATEAKVKVKDYGFKIYSDDETAVAKAKRDGAGYKLKREGGDTFGKLSASGGTFGSDAITVNTTGGRIEVSRGGTVVGAVDASVGAKAASFLAATELTPQQRVAAMIFVQEHQR